jgi:hydroxymethylglutaryl-CoA lyase
MSKELVRLAWAHAGDEEQEHGIKRLFREMMHPVSDSAHGVKEFQAGKKVDWDAFTQRTLKPRL